MCDAIEDAFLSLALVLNALHVLRYVWIITFKFHFIITFELVLPFPNCLLAFIITGKLFVGKFPQENVIGPLLFV